MVPTGERATGAGGGSRRRYARLAASTGLPAAVERIFAAVDPAVAADAAGLDYGSLDPEDRKLLAKAHREAIAEGIKLIADAAEDGDPRARAWLTKRGLTPRGLNGKTAPKQPVSGPQTA